MPSVPPCPNCRNEAVEPWTGHVTTLAFGDGASPGLRAALTGMPSRSLTQGYFCPACDRAFVLPDVAPVPVNLN